MAGPSGASFLSECRISVSQEEVLANLGGGWERSGHFSLDETPSQNFLNSSSPRVQQNLPNLSTRPPLSYDAESGSESSESVDGDVHLGFTQEPVEWLSPASSMHVSVGVERNDAVARADSYATAFESDRSQSLSQDWFGQVEQPDAQVRTPNLAVSAEFLTQPPAGVLKFQSEDPENQILQRESITESDLQILPEQPLPLSPIPENGVGVNETPVADMEPSIQPFTQPAVETQPLESSIIPQERSIQMEVASGGYGVVRDASQAIRGYGGADAELPERVLQGSGGGYELVFPAPDNDEGGTGSAEQMLQERGGDELPGDSGLSLDGKRDLTSTDHMQQDHGSKKKSIDIPHPDIQTGVLELSEKVQELTQCSKAAGLGTGRAPSDSRQREETHEGNGSVESFPKSLKRANYSEDMNGRQKLQRVEAPPVRARTFPRTVMDVVRSRSRSLSNSLVDDECNILSIVMRAGEKCHVQPFLEPRES